MQLARSIRIVLFALLATCATQAAEETLEKNISLEDPGFNCQRAVMTAGRDGKVYLLSGKVGNSHLIQMNPDGSEQVGIHGDSAPTNATANASGWIISGHAHLVHKITIRNPKFEVKAEFKDFSCSDKLGWDAPAHVEAGASGDFYVLDQHRDRILRIDANCKILRTIPLPHTPEGNPGITADFRVNEAHEMLVIRSRQGKLRAIGMDGKPKFEIPNNPSERAYDLSKDGTLFLLPYMGTEILRFDADGKPLAKVKLALGELKPDSKLPWFNELAFAGTKLLLRRAHETEFFREFDPESGAQENIVTSRYERMVAHFPSLTWNAGEAVPFKIEYEAAGGAVAPNWHVFARPLEAPGFTELKLHDNTLDIPATSAGLYLVEITTGLNPQQEKTDALRLLRTLVEIRKSGAKGTVAVMTPDNRVFYGRGEPIPLEISSRASQKNESLDVNVLLTDAAGTIVAQESVALKSDAPAKLTIPVSLTKSLIPGAYLLAPVAAGWTCVPQHLTIGAGFDDNPMFLMEYGDYGDILPTGDFWTAPTATENGLARKQKLGLNFIVDRLGSPLVAGHFDWTPADQKNLFAPLVKRLTDDPLAIPPEKSHVAPPLFQAMAATGAFGIHEMSILLTNDAGLPLGTGYDTRKPDDMVAAVKKITTALVPYPAFRGWIWASNWWVFGNRGSAAATTPEDKKAYDDSLKIALATGAWDPVIDKVSNLRVSYAKDACELFNAAKKEIAPQLVSAVAAPFRSVESYPPISLSAVDETDLQAQWEQMAIPFASAFNVDFYKRPGKPAWGHPEIWNDSGTGDQIGPTLFHLLMRGADGIGACGAIPPWSHLREDPRSAHFFTASVFRSSFALVKPYGALFRSLQNDDPVAILLSGRMYKTDTWKDVMGLHFSRVYESYLSCLYAGTPASLVFVEDLKPETLKKFKAILLVDQRFEPEPELLQALKSAQAGGTPVFYDGNCLEKFCTDFKPLGFKFASVETDRSPAGDDHAYWRFPAYAMANVKGLKDAFGAKVPPVAGAAAGEVLLSRRRGGEGEYLFVVQNSVPEFDPGQLWRVNLNVASRVPMIAPVQIADDDRPVYDLFALKRITPDHGTINVDLRSMPARVYAILPTAIEDVSLTAPAQIAAGQSIAWKAAVLDAKGNPIAAQLPLSVRLLDASGTVLDQNTAVAAAGEAQGTLTAPLLKTTEPLVLEATELCSGRSVRAKIAYAPTALPLKFSDAAIPAAPAAPAVRGKEPSSLAPGETLYGPHLRSTALSSDGKTALFSAMNWDHNLYAVDLDTGAVRWRNRIGHYFAFHPQTTATGFAAEGFDLKTGEGYFNYLIAPDGKLERRFALHGIPKRLPFRFVPGLFHDFAESFATSPDGTWTASCGDLGLAAWKKDGTPLFSLDWWKTDRHTLKLLALDAQTLLAVEGTRAQALDASTGKPKWDVNLGAGGDVFDVCATRDGKTTAVVTDLNGGRVLILRDGKLLRTLVTFGRRAALSPDGTLLLTFDRDLDCFSVETGKLLWSFSGDDAIRALQVSADGKRVAASSDMGTLYVFGSDGGRLLETDLGARCDPTWLPDGDLFLATWMGRVTRLDGKFKPRWSVLLAPEKSSMRGHQLDDDGTPTTRVPFVGTAEAHPLPFTPNLIAQTQFTFKLNTRTNAPLANDTKLLYDGKADAPANPWIDWHYVGFFAETSPFNTIEITATTSRVKLDAVTLVEDPAHPESWLRDATLEYWNLEKEEWNFAQALLSDAPVHSHTLPKPVESTRFRLVLPWGCAGNVRLAELVFHGQVTTPIKPPAPPKAAPPPKAPAPPKK